MATYNCFFFNLVEKNSLIVKKISRKCRVNGIRPFTKRKTATTPEDNDDDTAINAAVDDDT